MNKKSLIELFAIYSLLVFASVNCLADIASDLAQAQGYVQSQQYIESEAVCNDILSQNATLGQKMKAEKLLSFVYIKTGRTDEAKAAVDRLLKDYSSQPGMPYSMSEIADYYRNSEQYLEARQLYTRLLAAYPDSSAAVKYHTGLAVSNIRVGDFQSARVSADKLLTDYADNPSIGKRALEVAYNYYDFHKYPEARKFFEKSLSAASNLDYTVRSLVGVAKADIRLANITSAKALTDRLLADYSAQQSVPRRATLIANAYRLTGQHSDAKQLYTRLLAMYPNSDSAVRYQAGIASSELYLGNSAAAKAAIDKLFSDYQGHKFLTNAVFYVAEDYRVAAYMRKTQGLKEESESFFQKAITLGEIAQTLPESQIKIINQEMCYLTADCYSQLGYYQKAIENYQRIVDRYPEGKFAAHALFMVGRSHEKLRRHGRRTVAVAASRSFADPNDVTSFVVLENTSVSNDPNSMIAGAVRTDVQPISSAKDAYQKLLERYPDSRWAIHARRWLNKQNSN